MDFGALEADFRLARARPAGVRVPAGLPPALVRAGARISAAIDADAARHGEPPYHGRHHVAETVAAMELLCAEAVRLGHIPGALADLGIVAMIGHDLGHDGSLPKHGLLERRAAERVAVLAAELGEAAVGTITRVIHATAPALVPDNLRRAACPEATPLDRLCALANEADVFASLLPGLGCALAEDLAREWQAQDPARAAHTRSFQGRHQFLGIYRHTTEAAARLGVREMIEDQLTAFAPDGAQAFDAMDRDAAMRLYRQRLEGMGRPLERDDVG